MPHARHIARVLLGSMLVLALSGCGEAGTAESSGEALAREKCTRCHSYGRVERTRKDQAAWERTIDRMIGNGLQLTEEERSAILGYLTERDQE
jgi:hypothetical protein